MSVVEAVDKLCNAAVEAAEKYSVLVLSDRDIVDNVNNTYISPLLATGAVHYALLRAASA
jgi:hypothetical protein